MRKISKELEETDFFVDPRELTKEEHTIISDYIKLDKQKKKGIKNHSKLRVVIK